VKDLRSEDLSYINSRSTRNIVHHSDYKARLKAAATKANLTAQIIAQALGWQGFYDGVGGGGGDDAG
jgi:hypothetical protein